MQFLPKILQGLRSAVQTVKRYRSRSADGSVTKADRAWECCADADRKMNLVLFGFQPSLPVTTIAARIIQKGWRRARERLRHKRQISAFPLVNKQLQAFSHQRCSQIQEDKCTTSVFLPYQAKTRPFSPKKVLHVPLAFKLQLSSKSTPLKGSSQSIQEQGGAQEVVEETLPVYNRTSLEGLQSFLYGRSGYIREHMAVSSTDMNQGIMNPASNFCNLAWHSGYVRKRQIRQLNELTSPKSCEYGVFSDAEFTALLEEAEAYDRVAGNEPLPSQPKSFYYKHSKHLRKSKEIPEAAAESELENRGHQHSGNLQGRKHHAVESTVAPRAAAQSSSSEAKMPFSKKLEQPLPTQVAAPSSQPLLNEPGPTNMPWENAGRDGAALPKVIFSEKNKLCKESEPLFAFGSSKHHILSGKNGCEHLESLEGKKLFCSQIKSGSRAAQRAQSFQKAWGECMYRGAYRNYQMIGEKLIIT